MLTVLFAVFFFLLVADKLYYQNSMAAYAGNGRGVSDFTVILLTSRRWITHRKSRNISLQRQCLPL